MKVSIYIEAAGSAIGGLQFVAALLAEALAKDNQVDLFHGVPSLTAQQLAASTGTDLNGVQLHYVDVSHNGQQLSRRNPLSHYRSSQKILAELSEDYDLFVAIVHAVPPFSHAKKSALMVL